MKYAYVYISYVINYALKGLLIYFIFERVHNVMQIYNIDFSPFLLN